MIGRGGEGEERGRRDREGRREGMSDKMSGMSMGEE